MENKEYNIQSKNKASFLARALDESDLNIFYDFFKSWNLQSAKVKADHLDVVPNLTGQNIFNQYSFKIAVFDSQRIVGFAGIKEVHSYWNQLKTYFLEIFFLPKYQNQGLGGKLLEIVESECKNIIPVLEIDLPVAYISGLRFFLMNNYKMTQTLDIPDRIVRLKKNLNTRFETKYEKNLKSLLKKSPSELLLGERIYLKKHSVDLTQEMFNTIQKNRNYLTKYMPWAHTTLKVEDSLDWIKTTIEEWDRKNLFDYGIFNHNKNEYMGSIGIHTMSWAHHRAELGYWLREQDQGRGYISESIRVLEKECQKLGFHRLEIRCSNNNIRSALVALRNNYVLEACLSEDAIENGQFRDTLIFAKNLN